MAESRIEIKVGPVSFSGEGDGKWLSEQLDKILEKIPELANVAPPFQESGGGNGAAEPAHKKVKGTLASFLTGKNAKSSKTRKFLAVSAWLQGSENKKRLSTNDVTHALSQNSQGSVGNASQCLANNVKQGFCAKDGKLFYVTDEGHAELG